MPHDDAALSLRDGCGRDFAADRLGARGCEPNAVPFAAGPLRLATPNPAVRVRDRDLHRGVTGCAADRTRKTQIGRSPRPPHADPLWFPSWSEAALALASRFAAAARRAIGARCG